MLNRFKRTPQQIAEAPVEEEEVRREPEHPMSVVAPTTKMKAEVDSTDDFTVQGHYDGKLRCRNLTVAAGASVTGEISATMIRLLGTMVGDIKADAMIVHKGGVVEGTLKCKSMGVQPGSTIKAVVDCEEVSALSGRDETNSRAIDARTAQGVQAVAQATALAVARSGENEADDFRVGLRVVGGNANS